MTAPAPRRVPWDPNDRTLAPGLPLPPGAYVAPGAVLSGPYRYQLWRGYGTKRVCFVMLNPSTADARSDDPTLRKCVGFATRWGFTGVDLVNLFAWRATDPYELRDLGDEPRDLVGPFNDAHIADRVRAASRVVLAWGGHHEVRHLIDDRVPEVRKLVRAQAAPGVEIGNLGLCKSGPPRHPLMLPYSTPFQLIERGGE